MLRPPGGPLATGLCGQQQALWIERTTRAHHASIAPQLIGGSGTQTVLTAVNHTALQQPY